MSIVVQTLPFLALGVLVSGLIAASIPKDLLSRIAPGSPLLTVPATSVVGVVLLGCKYVSMPVSQPLMHKGLPQDTALTFLSAVLTINPVMPVATAVTFTNSSLIMVWARLIASLAAVIAARWLWVGAGKAEWMKPQGGHDHGHQSKATVLRETAMYDLLQTGGFLVIGATVAALMKAAVPAGFLAFLTEDLWSGIVVMALLVVLLSLCSEADAFVAASLPGASLTAQLASLTIEPMVGARLFTMQSGALGAKFATRLMLLTLFMCIWSTAVVGAVIFGTF